MHYIKLELFKTNKRGCHKILQHKRCHHLTLCSVIDPWVKDWFVRGWNFIPYLPPNHHPPIKKFAGFFSTNFYFYIWYFIWCLCENSWCHAISNFLGVDISDKKLFELITANTRHYFKLKSGGKGMLSIRKWNQYMHISYSCVFICKPYYRQVVKHTQNQWHIQFIGVTSKLLRWDLT